MFSEGLQEEEEEDDESEEGDLKGREASSRKGGYANGRAATNDALGGIQGTDSDLSLGTGTGAHYL